MYYKLLQTREYGNYRDMTVLLGHEIPVLTLQIIEKPVSSKIFKKK